MTDPLSHIENRLNALIDEHRSAYSHHSVLETIYDAISHGSRVQQNHMLFVGMTLGAHTEAMFSCLFRLVDKRKDAIGIENFLRLVSQHAEVLPYGSADQIRKRVARDLSILVEIQPLLDCLRGRRNKVGAHVSLDYLPDLGQRVREDYPLDYSAIETVLQELDFVLGHNREFCRGIAHVPAAHDQFFYSTAIEEVIRLLESTALSRGDRSSDALPKGGQQGDA